MLTYPTSGKVFCMQEAYSRDVWGLGLELELYDMVNDMI